MATLGCLAVGIAAGVGFVVVERRVKVPLLDLALLRNRVLVGSTVAILIGAGTINALMYLLSLYFQDPATLGFSPLQAGLATLPATAGLVAVAPLVPRLAAKFGGRSVVGAGFAITAVGFAVIGINQSSWAYAAFVLPLIAVAVGMGLSNGPASSAATAAVPAAQVGEASGVSNMARYVGAAVATALAASIYSSVIGRQTAAGAEPAEALSAGLGTASWVMAVFSVAGVLMAVVMGRHRAGPGHPPRRRRVRRGGQPHPAHHRDRDPRPGGRGFRPLVGGLPMTDQLSRTAPAPFTADDYAARRQRAAQAGQEAGLAGLLVTPGPDLIYFTGYEPVAITERITMLVIPVDGEPAMIVPKLERPDAENAAGASPSAWWTGRTAATRTRPRRSCWPTTGRYAVSDSAWAMHLLGLQGQLPRRPTSR